MTTIEPGTIPLVEDDPGHARLIERNLRRSGVTNALTDLVNGQQAVDYLFSEGEYAGAEPSMPVLVLLDLNMPVLDGYEVLERMKSDERTKRIPVIILPQRMTDAKWSAATTWAAACT